MSGQPKTYRPYPPKLREYELNLIRRGQIQPESWDEEGKRLAELYRREKERK